MYIAVGWVTMLMLLRFCFRCCSSQPGNLPCYGCRHPPSNKGLAADGKGSRWWSPAQIRPAISCCPLILPTIDKTSMILSCRCMV